jgi:serine/threonine protein kinase
VYKVKSRVNKKYYALKKLRAKKKALRKRTYNRALREIQIHLRLNQHPNVIKLVSAS